MITDLCATSRDRLESCPGAAGPVAVLDRVGVRDGQPFILGGDGSYDLQLNRFLRELPSWGVRAENSVLAYARDVMLFVRFLETSRYGKPIWACDGDDLRAYKRVRLWCSGPGAVKSCMMSGTLWSVPGAHTAERSGLTCGNSALRGGSAVRATPEAANAKPAHGATVTASASSPGAPRARSATAVTAPTPPRSRSALNAGSSDTRWNDGRTVEGCASSAGSAPCTPA